MFYRLILGFLTALILCSCAQQTSISAIRSDNETIQQVKSQSGLKIEYGPNLGAIDKYAAGDYIFITATITNDTIIPVHLQVAISGEFNFPDSCSDSSYKVFLLPKELTPDTATLYNSITDGLAGYLERCLDDPYVLNRTLEPGEYSVITIGALHPRPVKCSVVALPRAVFIQGDGHNFQECDSRMNQDESTKTKLELGAKFVFYRGKSQPETSVFHPCGQISYLDR